MLAMFWAAIGWGWALAKDLPYTSFSLLSSYPKTFTSIAGVSLGPGVEGGREGHSTDIWQRASKSTSIVCFNVMILLPRFLGLHHRRLGAVPAFARKA